MRVMSLEWIGQESSLAPADVVRRRHVCLFSGTCVCGLWAGVVAVARHFWAELGVARCAPVGSVRSPNSDFRDSDIGYIAKTETRTRTPFFGLR